MIYQEALDYIKNIERAGSDFGIERMRMLLDMLGEPDRCLKFVHVAGTNGKGSVCAYLTYVLKAAGYRVGTYNSPSVFCYNERWSIDAKPLDGDSVAKYISEVKDVIDCENERRKALGLYDCEKDMQIGDAQNLLQRGAFNPTAFEIETAVAMLAFKDKGCDIAVLETGLGGRWDATNAVREKELAVITPIGLDHCAILGDTLGEIAEEKAAIIRGDAVTCEQCDEIMRKIFHPYETVGDRIVLLPANVIVCKKATLISDSLNVQIFEYGGERYEIGLLGEHQIQNASIAICAAETLRKKGWNISDDALKAGLKSARWQARLEIVKDAQKRFKLSIPSDKTLVFDGAHNPHGATALKKALIKYFSKGRIHLVIGILADKDVDGVISILAPIADRVTAVTPNSPRALNSGTLKEKVTAYAPCDECDDIRLAVQNALAGDCDTVALCGSLTLFSSLDIRK
ncbi:MAG: bifunctional folylpolyglutamate synthase/dihydrofolate synthase [Bacteroides sp.]|nr:bifunctional folylpolyglutamate synthase/dihydrofolate synthase [Bacillota bacterium]MCM1394086.1 bifunctional folylpolyglutamate synthase/dihydrofolate synthase [[Eubacterium] siraeum]MCM1455162.1 bifunctional folylpolyglutamate synthase/dihydrofolate synthase [Bacteroides sp.]